jgi:hypothetical protein
VPECDLETSTLRRPRSTTAVQPWKKRVGLQCLSLRNCHNPSVTSSLNARYYPQHSLRNHLRHLLCRCNLVTSFYTYMKSEAKLELVIYIRGLSRWSRGLRRRSATARLLGSRVQILLRTWTSVSCYLLCRYCVSMYRPLRRADHLYRGVLMGIRVQLCVIYEPQQ